MRTCKKCKWWKFNSDAVEPDECDIGYCRRNAPPCKATEEQCHPSAVWPVTYDCDWCGEFKEKENE